MSGINSSNISGSEFARQVATITPKLEQSKQGEFVSSITKDIQALPEINNANKEDFLNVVRDKYLQAGGKNDDLTPLIHSLLSRGLDDDFKSSFLGEINPSRVSDASEALQHLQPISQSSVSAAAQNPDEDVKEQHSDEMPVNLKQGLQQPRDMGGVPYVKDSMYANNVAMGAYAITDPTKDKCIKTIGLSPCVCIFMRDDSGKSLLAHLDASDDKPRTINALKEAFRQAGGDPDRSSVTIVGGNDSTDSSREFIDAIKGGFRGDQINPISYRVTLGSTPRDVIFSVKTGNFGLITNPLKPADAENPADKGYLPPSGTPFPRYGAA